jgi:hypothetical protein
MLMRLQTTLGCTDLVNQMLLVPQANGLGAPSASEINLVVGYSSSPRSQTALDLTLWIAHQTRLATGKPVTVQVVYVMDHPIAGKIPVFDASVVMNSAGEGLPAWAGQADWAVEADRTAQSCMTIAALPEISQPWFGDFQATSVDQFEQADRILWQARCLADEWRGSLKTHLRFGPLAHELVSVVKSEAASLLILGCESARHPLVQQLGTQLPCPVLGIPLGGTLDS